MSESSGEKTEQPSHKRLQDARKKGQVAKSQDLSSAVMLFIATAIVWVMSSRIGELFKGGMEFFFERIGERKVGDPINISAVMWQGLIMLAWSVVPLLLVMFVVAFMVNFLQVGSLFAVEALKPDFNKLNPVGGFKNKFFKSRTYLEFAKNLLKITIAAVVAFTIIKGAVGDIINLTGKPIDVGVAFVVGLVVKVFIVIAGVFLFLGAGDFLLQYFLHRKELMMTKQEVKQEYKESEGDPMLKWKRKSIHREVVQQAIAAAVQKSNVVVANPTHIAVALSYEQGGESAPVIVAKGADLMAAQIRKIAEEADVPIMRDIPLARSLYELEVDEEIPEELFEAVAVVLRWVYEISGEEQSVK